MKKASKRQLEALTSNKSISSEIKSHKPGSSFFAFKRVVIKHVEEEQHETKNTENKASDNSVITTSDSTTHVELNINNANNNAIENSNTDSK